MVVPFQRIDKRVDAPELPRLPVVREDYCSQEMTDALCDYVMENAPWDTVLFEIYQEDDPVSLQPYIQNDPVARVRDFIKDVVSKDISVPETDLGILDFGYEFRRRVRVSQGWTDVPVEGHPLAPTPDGPYPEMIRLPIRDYSKSRWPITQELADQVIDLAYKNRPDIFYLRGEYSRRWDNYWEVAANARQLLTETCIECGVLEENSKNVPSGLYFEFDMRILIMCEIPRFLKSQNIKDKE